MPRARRRVVDSGAPANSAGDAGSATATVAAAHGETSHMERLPTELLLQVFASLDTETLLLSVPGVCRRWRAEYGHTCNVCLDLTFVGESTLLYKRIRGNAGRRALCELVQRFSKVTEFTWSCGARLTDKVGIALVERLPHLVTLVLSSGMFEHCLSDDWHEALATHCRSLRRVSLSGSSVGSGVHPHLTDLEMCGNGACPHPPSTRPLTCPYNHVHDRSSVNLYFFLAPTRCFCATAPHMSPQPRARV
jgi:hypothetical protein